jgi:hypothetical protein
MAWSIHRPDHLRLAVSRTVAADRSCECVG